MRHIWAFAASELATPAIYVSPRQHPTIGLGGAVDFNLRGIFENGWPRQRTKRRPTTVEDGHTIDLSSQFRKGWLRSAAGVSAVLSVPSASINFESQLDARKGHVRLGWTLTDPPTGTSRRFEKRIELRSRPQPFVGLRWWFLCPLTGKLANRLKSLPKTPRTPTWPVRQASSRRGWRLIFRDHPAP